MGAAKFVLFVVEGETDELALGRALTSLFATGDKPGPRFGIIRGDITSAHALGAGNPASTIKRRLVAAVKEFLAKDKLRAADLDAIVLLSDTDGAFIDDSAVVYREEKSHCSYLEDRIETSDVDSLRLRNQIKASCLKTLSRTNELTCDKKKIPFKVAYMSRNLEHALSDYPGYASQQKNTIWRVHFLESTALMSWRLQSFLCSLLLMVHIVIAGIILPRTTILF